MNPQFRLKNATCGEWEISIFFNDLDDSFKSDASFWIVDVPLHQSCDMPN